MKKEKSWKNQPTTLQLAAQNDKSDNGFWPFSAYQSKQKCKQAA
ncbi:MAG: hypothetical protein Q7T66_03140 [Herminiimonas sp.]|nr:hypothetical protein [Herminiimonas sp.]MDO9419638.1 hypothetical protein [Herminiimonas sp.]